MKASPKGMLFLIQNFVKLYALLTETAILILNVYEQMIEILESKIKNSSYMKKFNSKNIFNSIRIHRLNNL